MVQIDRANVTRFFPEDWMIDIMTSIVPPVSDFLRARDYLDSLQIQKDTYNYDNEC